MKVQDTGEARSYALVTALNALIRKLVDNGFVSSIRAKRAWAEVDTEFGSIRFGRMPWHWGRGVFFNQGSCADCDVGTTVDRTMALR